MNKLTALLAFAITLAVGLALTQLASVYLLDYWEPAFGDRGHNVVLFLEALPFLMALASVSFVVGLQMSAAFKQFDKRAAAKVGALSAILTYLAVVLAIAVNYGGYMGAELATLAAAPSLSAVVAAIFIERRSHR